MRYMCKGVDKSWTEDLFQAEVRADQGTAAAWANTLPHRFKRVHFTGDDIDSPNKGYKASPGGIGGISGVCSGGGGGGGGVGGGGGIGAGGGGGGGKEPPRKGWSPQLGAACRTFINFFIVDPLRPMNVCC